jgi:hypothetical protein
MLSRENHSRASASQWKSQWKKRFSGGNRRRHKKSTTPRTRTPAEAAGQSKETNSPIAVWPWISAVPKSTQVISRESCTTALGKLFACRWDHIPKT